MNKRFNNDDWTLWIQNACPMFVTVMFDPAFNDMRKYIGSPYFNLVAFFGEDDCGNYMGRIVCRHDEVRLLGVKLLDMLLCPQYRDSFDKLVAKTKDKCIKETKVVLSNEYSITQALDKFDKLAKLYANYMKYALLHESIQAQAEYVLRQYVEKNYPASEVNDVMITLMTPTEDTFSVDILKSLYRCSLAYEAKSDELQELLDDHSRRFHWKMNNYYSITHVTAEDVLKEVKEHSSAYYNNLIKQASELKEKTLKAKQGICDTLPSHIKNIVDIINTYGGKFIDDRQFMYMHTDAGLDRLLQVVARHTNTPIEDVRLLTPRELRYFASNPTSYKQRFEERKERFLWVQTDFPLIDEIIEKTDKLLPMREPFIAEGDVAMQVAEKLNARLNFFDTDDLSNKTLKGVVPYKADDEIIGIVRVIKNPKTEKLNVGEILVSPSTTPDYLTAMHNSIAIIVDYGGLTSHAGIISRELKKPCIIGTNYASAVLKTGQRVRMNFVDGTIEVIE